MTEFIVFLAATLLFIFESRIIWRTYYLCGLQRLIHPDISPKEIQSLFEIGRRFGFSAEEAVRADQISRVKRLTEKNKAPLKTIPEKYNAKKIRVCFENEKNELQQAFPELLFDDPEWQYKRFIRENGLEGKWE